jgi:hypothetical protein
MTLTTGMAGVAAFTAVLLAGLPSTYADPTPGKACHASTSSGDKVNDGKYNDRGECCGPKTNGPVRQFCINCNNSRNFCADGKEEK